MHRAHRRPTIALAAFALLALARADAHAGEPGQVVVYRSPTCGCCEKWAQHLEAAGFVVEIRNSRDMESLKAAQGVPRELAACHTAIVEGYVVEGHVPARDVARLLAERPEVSGLAVPGMPIGSPGMEGPNPERYRVLSFAPGGEIAVFAVHGP